MSKKKGKGGPRMTDQALYLQAGIDPNTKLPTRLLTAQSKLKDQIKRNIKIVDEQNAVNRYQWYNVPADITSQEIERLLYFKGQVCFFLNKDNKKFYFMPYALDGSIDFYGRFRTIHPVPWADAGEDTPKEEAIRIQKQKILLSTLKLKVIYDIPLEPIDILEVKKDKNGNIIQNGYCVLLHDYTKGFSQTIIPRNDLQEGIIDLESDMLPYCRTALRNSTGIKGLKVMNEDEQLNVDNANAQIEQAALNGEKYIPIIGNADFQDLADGSVGKAEDYLLAMQSAENIRLSFHGLQNGGIFQKKSHILESEESINSGDVDAILQDGLSIRQNFCDIVNATYGTAMYVEISDSAVGADSNMDGMTSDEQDQTGLQQGAQAEPTMEE